MKTQMNTKLGEAVVWSGAFMVLLGISIAFIIREGFTDRTGFLLCLATLFLFLASLNFARAFPTKLTPEEVAREEAEQSDPAKSHPFPG